MSYHHFTLEEREYLQQKRRENWSIRQIAYSMNRSPSSVSREIKRNCETDGRYRPFRADRRARTRHKKCRKARLIPGTKEWIFVIEKLSSYWSPEAISGRWILDNPTMKPISYSTIYRYIYKGAFPSISKQKNLRRHGNKKRIKKGLYVTIKPDRIIPQWPKVIVNRGRYGDWEGDTVAGKIGTGLITTLVDRKSRFLLAQKVETKTSSEQLSTIISLLKNHPVKSISFDNGVEFAAHREMEHHLSTKVYFAEPHKPWQRGTNENTNDILRFFFPKGSDFSKITQKDIDKVVNLINNRPKKCLGWKTPAEVYSRHHKKCCT